MPRKILGIVGSYRRNGVIDTLVSEVLASAREHGAETEKIYLLDAHIEFCTNCRACTQKEGSEPGACVHDDDMSGILARYLASDAVVIGAPVNCYNVNALTRRFMERLIVFSYWPWGGKAPRLRKKDRGKKAVLVTATAMPSFFGRIFTGAERALKLTAQTLGAKPVSTVFAGMIAQKEKPPQGGKAFSKAREAGRKIAVE
jgi:multimeric flavodoxin WrbA